MTATRFRIISIGSLERHPMWPSDEGGRTGHATTTLIESLDPDGETRAAIIVDPGLPSVALEARFAERTGLAPSDITHVFLTSFHPDCRRGVELFEGAALLISETERETVGVTMLEQLQRMVEGGEGDSPAAGAIRSDVELLRRLEPAPDRLIDGVDLFPMPGVTPGMAGLLVNHPRYTALVAGDAVATREHLERGQVLRRAADVAQAKQSLREAVEIADYIVPGRDDLLINPMAGPMTGAMAGID
jgi:glyoxylase-like metal-dependent hydrolase (beta-lactamase superfamily II)